MGMDDLDNGRKFSGPLIGRKSAKKEVPTIKLKYYMDITVVQRFNMLHQQHEPMPTVRSFLELVLNLGVKAYEREYTIWGFRKD